MGWNAREGGGEEERACVHGEVGGEGSVCNHHQFSVLLSQAKIAFNSWVSLLPQNLFRLSHCSTADSLGCPFFFFDSIKYTAASHKSVAYQRINHIYNKGPLLFNWTVH